MTSLQHKQIEQAKERRRTLEEISRGYQQEIYLNGTYVGDGEPLVSAERVAAYMCITKQSVYNKVWKKQLPHYKIGSSIRFRMSEIEEWITSNKAI